MITLFQKYVKQIIPTVQEEFINKGVVIIKGHELNIEVLNSANKIEDIQIEYFKNYKNELAKAVSTFSDKVLVSLILQYTEKHYNQETFLKQVICVEEMIKRKPLLFSSLDIDSHRIASADKINVDTVLKIYLAIKGDIQV